MPPVPTSTTAPVGSLATRASARPRSLTPRRSPAITAARATVTARALRSTGQGYGAVGAAPESADCSGFRAGSRASAPRRGARVRAALATRQNGAVTTPADRTVPRHRWLLAAVVIALAALPVVLRYLVFWPLDQWQVDVEVYREAGVSHPHRPPGLRRAHRGPAAAPLHLPAVRGGARAPPGDDAVRRGRVAVDGAAGARDHRHRLVRRVPPDPPRRRVGAARPRPAHRPDAVAAPGERRHPLRAGQRVHGARLPDGPARAAPRPGAPGAARGARRPRDGGQADPGRLRRALPRHQAVEGGGDRRRHRRGRHARGVGAAAAGVVRVLGRRAAGPGPARPEHGHVQPVDPRLPAAGRARGDAGHAALAGLRRRRRGVRVLAGPPPPPRRATRSARSPRSG